MAASTSIDPLKCQNCPATFDFVEGRRPHRICHDRICELCVKKLTGPQTAPECEREDGLSGWSCTVCKALTQESLGEDSPLISLMIRINELEGVINTLRQSQPSCAASSSGASSSRDVDYDPSLYDPVKPASVVLSPMDKALDFLDEKDDILNLHGLTENDLNEILDKDRGLFIDVLNKLHLNINKYDTNLVDLEKKYNKNGEAYQRYTTMVLLAANEKAAIAGIRLAYYYSIYACELGLRFPDRQQNIEEYYKQCVKDYMEIKFNASIRLALIYCKQKLKSFKEYTRIYDAHSFDLARGCIASDQNFSYQSPSFKTTSFRGGDDSLLQRLQIFMQSLQGQSFEWVNTLIQLKDRGDVDATCFLAEILLSKESLESTKDRHAKRIIDALIKQATIWEHPKACALLGLYYYEGEYGLAENLEEAEKCFRIGYSNGCPLCTYWLAQILKTNRRERENVKKLFALAISGGTPCEEEARKFASEGTDPRPRIIRPNLYHFWV